jgi:hypothetical protein
MLLRVIVSEDLFIYVQQIVFYLIKKEKGNNNLSMVRPASSGPDESSIPHMAIDFFFFLCIDGIFRS